MKTRIVLICTIIIAVIISCNQSKNETKQATFSPSQTDDSILTLANNFFKPLPAIADSKDNPVTESKVRLGKFLFYDVRLSKAGNISCNSCHNLQTHGVDNQSFSKGDAGTLGNRNSPTVFNAALHNMQFWDGRAKDVEEQAGMPILNPVEMAIPHKGFLVDRLSGIQLYQEMFKQAFPGEVQSVTYDNLQKAIAAFERTLLTPSRFDAYMQGQKDALTADEKEGLQVFVSSGCIACHNGVGVGGGTLQRFGVVTDYRTLTNSKTEDAGRQNVTQSKDDKDKFKVAGLRNASGTYPYFHDGSIANLDTAVIIMAKAQLNKNLSKEETKQIVAFLNALSGDVTADAKTIPPELIKQ